MSRNASASVSTTLERETLNATEAGAPILVYTKYVPLHDLTVNLHRAPVPKPCTLQSPAPLSMM
jgi:hypothetical protein